MSIGSLLLRCNVYLSCYFLSSHMLGRTAQDEVCASNVSAAWPDSH